MATMIFFENRKIRRLAKEYRMPESDIRQMLAFERGTTTGDMKDVRDARPQSCSIWCVQWVVSIFSTLGLTLRHHA